MIDLIDLEEKYDNGGRRRGDDRRQFSYAMYLPERRTGNDRRSGTDRRMVWDLENRQYEVERRRILIAS
jgi:hypothetical protein